MGVAENLERLICDLRKQEEQTRITAQVKLAEADLLRKILDELDGIVGWQGTTGEFPALDPTKGIEVQP